MFESQDLTDMIRSMSADRFLSSAEVAELLNISRKTVWAHARQGKIKYVRAGRNFRFPPQAVADYLLLGV